MELFAGKTLKRADGSSVQAESALQGKSLVFIYFSAHWCPPCRSFTPKLKEVYEKAQNEGIEVIFVSSDQTLKDMESYMKESHGNWLAVEYDSELAKTLNSKFEVEGIPTLVVLKQSGELISKDGYEDVASKGIEVVQEWKSKL